MLLLNFSHPLTPQQQAQIETILTRPIERVIPIPTQFDNQQPYLPQLAKLLEQVPISADEWQTTPMLIILPALNFITAILLAELHGRMGYFPPVVRLRPIPNSLPLQFEVAEILNLQQIREDARRQR